MPHIYFLEPEVYHCKRNDSCFALVFYHLLLELFTRIALSLPSGKPRKRSQGCSKEISVPKDRYNDYKHPFYNCSMSFKQLHKVIPHSFGLLVA